MYSYIRNFLQLSVSGLYGVSEEVITVKSLPDDFPDGTFNVEIPFVWYNRTNHSAPSTDLKAEFVSVYKREGYNLFVRRGQQGTFATTKDTLNKHYVLELVISKSHFDELRAAINVVDNLKHNHSNSQILDAIEVPLTNEFKERIETGLIDDRNPLPHEQGSSTIVNQSTLSGNNITDVFETINEDGIDIKDLQISGKRGGILNINDIAIVDQVMIKDVLLIKWYIHIIDQANNKRQSLEILAHYNGIEVDYTIYACIGESSIELTAEKSGANIILKATASANGQSVYVFRNSIKSF